MLWPQPDIPIVVAPLMVIAQRVTPGFRCRLVKPALRKNAPHRLDPHGRRALALIGNDRYVELGVAQMVLIALAGDTVRGHAIVRQGALNLVITAIAQLSDVIAEHLAHALDVIEHPDFLCYKLHNPDR